MLILGIESSCDDAAAAVIESDRPGVAPCARAPSPIRTISIAHMAESCPELASRNHVMTIMPVIERALAGAGCTLGELDGIAVTRGPGLVGSLLVGLMCAKGIAQATGIATRRRQSYRGPSAGPDDRTRGRDAVSGAGGLGRPTALFAVEDFGRYRRLGIDRDDAAGEAFDKVAKLMGLGYPGGKIIDELSRTGARDRVKITRARVKGAPLDFSFSGVKTAVGALSRERRAAGRLRPPISPRVSRKQWSRC